MSSKNEIDVKWRAVEVYILKAKGFFKMLPQELRPAAFVHLLTAVIEIASNGSVYIAKGILKDASDQLAEQIAKSLEEEPGTYRPESDEEQEQL